MVVLPSQYLIKRCENFLQHLNSERKYFCVFNFAFLLVIHCYCLLKRIRTWNSLSTIIISCERKKEGKIWIISLTGLQESHGCYYSTTSREMQQFCKTFEKGKFALQLCDQTRNSSSPDWVMQVQNKSFLFTFIYKYNLSH